MGAFVKLRTGVLPISIAIHGVVFDCEFSYDEDSEFGVNIETAKLQGRDWLEHLKDEDVSLLASGIAGANQFNYREAA